MCFAAQFKPSMQVPLLNRPANYESGVARFSGLSLPSRCGASLRTNTPCGQSPLLFLKPKRGSQQSSHLDTKLLPYDSSFYSLTFYYLPLIEWWKFVKIMLGSNYEVLGLIMSEFKIYQIFNSFP